MITLSVIQEIIWSKYTKKIILNAQFNKSHLFGDERQRKNESPHNYTEKNKND